MERTGLAKTRNIVNFFLLSYGFGSDITIKPLLNFLCFTIDGRLYLELFVVRSQILLHI